VPWVQIPSYYDFYLYVQKEEFPSEWTLSLIARYKNVVIHHTDVSGKSIEHDARGFYLLKTETALINFERQDSKWSGSIKAYIDKVWHVGGTSSIKLQAKITPIDLQEINKKTGGQDLKVSWTVSGYGFLEEEDAKTFGYSLIRIEASSDTNKAFSKGQFIKQILEPIDRFKREFVEITIPSVESISHVPQELQTLATLFKDRSIFLEDALKKLYQATNSREYAGAIGDIRRGLGAMEKQLRSIKNSIAERLFLEMGIFTGEGAESQSKAIVD